MFLTRFANSTHCAVLRCVSATVRRIGGTNLIWFGNELTSRATTYVNSGHEKVCEICLFLHRGAFSPQSNFRGHCSFYLFIYL